MCMCDWGLVDLSMMIVEVCPYWDAPRGGLESRDMRMYLASTGCKFPEPDGTVRPNETLGKIYAGSKAYENQHCSAECRRTNKRTRRVYALTTKWPVRIVQDQNYGWTGRYGQVHAQRRGSAKQ